MSMINPSRDGYKTAQQSHGSAPFNGHISSSFEAVENSGPVMLHNSGISVDWNTKEQAILEEGLNTFGQNSNLVRYAKIAALLPNKTVRDVAFRVQWRKQRERERKRQEDSDVAKKSKDKMVSGQQREKSSQRKADSGVDKKENMIDPSGKSTQLEVSPRLSPYAQAVAGANGLLLMRNSVVLLHLDVNINSYRQTHRNIPLFREVRDNILKVMSNMGEMPEAYKHFPPLPVKLNEKLANSVLPPPPSLDSPNATNVNYDPHSNM